MKLAGISLIASKIVDVDDPLKEGRVRLEITGEFDGLQKEHIPWAYPLFRSHSNSHSTRVLGDWCFALFNPDMPHEIYFIDKSNLSNDSKKHIINDQETYEDAEVLFSRDTPNGLAEAFYNNKEGINLILGTSNIQIDRNLNILLKTDKSSIIAQSDGHIVLNCNDDPAEPAVLGDKNKEAMEAILKYCDDIQKALTDVSSACTSGPLSPIFSALSKSIPTLAQDSAKSKKALSLILSETIKIS